MSGWPSSPTVAQAGCLSWPSDGTAPLRCSGTAGRQGVELDGRLPTFALGAQELRGREEIPDPLDLFLTSGVVREVLARDDFGHGGEDVLDLDGPAARGDRGDVRHVDRRRVAVEAANRLDLVRAQAGRLRPDLLYALRIDA